MVGSPGSPRSRADLVRRSRLLCVLPATAGATDRGASEVRARLVHGRAHQTRTGLDPPPGPPEGMPAIPGPIFMDRGAAKRHDGSFGAPGSLGARARVRSARRLGFARRAGSGSFGAPTRLRP